MVYDWFTRSHGGTIRPMAAQSRQALAEIRRPWHGGRMQENSSRASRAGGVIIAFSIIAGAILGNRMGQPSIGMLAGTGIGIAISLLLFLYDRRRQG